MAEIIDDVGDPPKAEDFEVTLLGPGYGESIVLHVGNGVWILIDSYIHTDGTPVALDYLRRIGIDPAHAVRLIVATHWHDDHIRGMTKLVTECSNARFSCADAFCKREVLAIVGALAHKPASQASSGLEEIYGVITRLTERNSTPTYASANQRIFANKGCEIWSLSPSGLVFHRFLESLSDQLPSGNRTKTRVRSLSPNDVAVALWVRVGDAVALLGSDLERSGWIHILGSRERPSGQASVFKVPHHGSQNAHVADVWRCLLAREPYALVTPWRRGTSTLPSVGDMLRIRSYTRNGYITSVGGAGGRSRSGMVDRTLRKMNVQLRRVMMTPGAIRLRRPVSETTWTVEKLGTARELPSSASAEQHQHTRPRRRARRRGKRATTDYG